MTTNNNITKHNSCFTTRYYVFFLVLSLITIFVSTFTNPEPDYGIGLDASYVWGYNNLFAQNYDMLLDLVYPLGPLFVLKTPTTQSSNLLVYLVFYTALKLTFLLCFFLTAKRNNVNMLATFVLAFLASFNITVDYLILFTCSLLCIAYLRRRKAFFLILSSLLATTGLCIKSSIGIISFSVVGFSFLIYLYTHRNWRQSAMELLYIFLPFAIIGCSVFKGLFPFVHYINATVHLVSGYGSTLALYPQNNYWIVAFGCLLWAVFPFLKRNSNLSIFFLITSIAFFSSFKHAFIRQDIWHYQQILYFLLTWWAIAIILSGKLKPLGAVFCILSVGCFTLNAQNLDGFEHLQPDFSRFKDFKAYYFSFQKTKTYYEELDKQALKADILPLHLINKIGNSTVDCYPWEHLYARANNLKWQPRKTIELGASTSVWTSCQAAENYKGNGAVEFVIWHLQKNDPTKTIDDRYFLNDEPQVVQTLLSSYDIIDTAAHCMLLKRNPSKHSFPFLERSSQFTARLNEWVKVPHKENAITKAKIHTANTFQGKLKAFLLKDVAYFIDYKAQNGQIYSYRLTPFAMTEGLWSQPLILFNANNVVLMDINQIRIRTNNDKYVKNTIQIQWEYFLKPN